MTIEEYLTQGGDRRISCDPLSGLNHYGCPPFPQPLVLAYGSSTASAISASSQEALEAYWHHFVAGMGAQDPALAYASELESVRGELIGLCALEDLAGLEIIIGASGTDLHLFASQIMAADGRPRSIVMTEATETGLGVPAALDGRHFSDCAAVSGAVQQGAALAGSRPCHLVAIPSRSQDSQPRPIQAVDAEVEAAVEAELELGRNVLLIVSDLSKTGLVAPGPTTARELQGRHPGRVEVLVDACQFRLSCASLRAYLVQGFMVALTGSKFVSGPAFSGALMVPPALAARCRLLPLPESLGAYSVRADWPADWALGRLLPQQPNFGLLLRWKAALMELRAFRGLPEPALARFLERFAAAVTEAMEGHACMEALPVPELRRLHVAHAGGWDRVPTLFPFLLRQRDYFSVDETADVYRNLRLQHIQLGQPCLGGTRSQKPVHALRLCLSMRQVVDALSEQGRGEKAVVAEALSVLERVSLLAASRT
jgi:hypothetical protein